MIQRASSSLLVFSLAAAAQQVMVLGMSLLLMPSPEAPDLRWVMPITMLELLEGIQGRYRLRRSFTLAEFPPKSFLLYERADRPESD